VTSFDSFENENIPNKFMPCTIIILFSLSSLKDNIVVRKKPGLWNQTSWASIPG
jgi:hypothetical protein